MKRTFGHWAWLILFSALLASCPVLILGDTRPLVEVKTDVDIDEDNIPPSEVEIPEGITYKNGTLFFNGSIDEKSSASFLTLAEQHKDAIKSVQVNSGGGTTHYGRQIGRWIYEQKADVIVDGLCFSSCANYIFTAGKKKIIRNNALVGWHGSLRQDLVFANTEDMDEAFERRKLAGMGLSKEWKDLINRNSKKYKRSKEDSAKALNNILESTKAQYKAFVFLSWKRTLLANRQFFKDIGVDIDVTVYGQYKGRREALKSLAKTKRIDGWTFSIEAMKEFDIEDVEFEGEGTYPQAHALQQYRTYEYKGPIKHLKLPVVDNITKDGI